MTRRERMARLRKELRIIYAAIKKADFDVRVVLFRDPKQVGYYVPGDGKRRNHTLMVDMHRNVVGTFIHELLHHLEPGSHIGKAHKRVYARERFIVRSASAGQVRRLLRKFHKLWRATISMRFRGRPMPHCPLCGQRVRRMTLDELKQYYHIE